MGRRMAVGWKADVVTRDRSQRPVETAIFIDFRSVGGSVRCASHHVTFRYRTKMCSVKYFSELIQFCMKILGVKQYLIHIRALKVDVT